MATEEPNRGAEVTETGVTHSADPTSFMKEAFGEAQEALAAGEVPVGAVVVMEGEIVGRGGNRVITDRDPTAHAEVVAMRRAAQRTGNYRLVGCGLYVTVEPCIMCAGAIIQARIDYLYYGASDPKAGAVDSLYKILGDRRFNHRVMVTGGILEQETAALVRRFFDMRR